MMLGKTAGGLFWMFRNLERSENYARLLDAGFRMALTRSESADDEWASVITTAGVRDAFEAAHDHFDAASVIDFLLRDRDNPSSVLSVVENARNNARLVRTALSREVWEATNETWMSLTDLLSKPVKTRDLPDVLTAIRHHSAVVRGSLHGTMLRNEIYNFCRIGTFLERADSTARIVDVKYHVLLPSVSHVGSSLDNVQWETILRSASSLRTFRWLHKGDITPMAIADFMVLDARVPRSLAYCFAKTRENLEKLDEVTGQSSDSRAMADGIDAKMRNQTIERVFDSGLHEFLIGAIADAQMLGRQIETDYRFSE